MKEHKIKSLSQLLTLVRASFDYDDVLYRGDRKIKELKPRIAECIPNNDMPRIQMERAMFDDFMRQAIPLSEFKPDTKWDWLSLAQHHGMATRLLDWSLNPLAAVWFAVNRPSTSNAVVWVLIPTAEDYLDPIVDSEPFEIKRTKIFRPKHISRRIAAQMGWFTAHWYNSKNNRYAALDKIKGYEKQLQRILIEPTHFENIRSELDICGVNASTMFPDVDGLAKHIEWRYTLLKDEKA